MNITVNSQTLAAELRLLNKIVPSKPAIHILSHVLLQTDERGLNFYATDLEVGLSTRCDAEVHAPGRMALPAARLLSLVEQFTDSNVTLSLEPSAGNLTHVAVRCGTFNSRLQAMTADDFPEPPAFEGTATAKLDLRTFRQTIERTRYAINAAGSKAILSGSLLTLHGPAVVMVATDTKRLVLVTMGRNDDPTNNDDVAVIVPAKALDAVLSQPDEDDQLTLSLDERHILFVVGDRVLKSRMLAGKYPAYERVIPKANQHVVVVQRGTLSAALRRVRLISEETKAVYFTFAENSVHLQASSAEVGAADEAVAVEYTGPTIKVCANGEHVLDFLNAAAGQTVSIHLKDAKTPLLLTDGADHLSVIMVMK